MAVTCHAWTVAPRRAASASRGGERRTRLERVRARTADAERSDVETVAVFVNKKSGGRRGRDVLRTLREVMKPPHQVFDASNAASADVDERASKVLVCGGDGSVGLVSDALRAKRREQLPIAILPLGTGNDLARVLGWKSNVWDDLSDEEAILQTLRVAEPCAVDRWRVDIVDRKPRRSKLFTNYLGIGVDARAALAFHEARKVYPWLFVHELTNKLLYGVFGSRDFIEHSFAKLRDDLVIIADGAVVDLPEDTEGVILCNINSFSGGVRVWDWEGNEDAAFRPSRKDDGVIEIVAVSGALHLGQLNVRIASPSRVAQARDVSIELKRKLPVQVDGEPWLQRRGRLDVRLHDSFAMLRRHGSSTVSTLVDDDEFVVATRGAASFVAATWTRLARAFVYVRERASLWWWWWCNKSWRSV